LKNNEKNSPESSLCPHKNVKQEGGHIVCQDCGLILEEKAFDKAIPRSEYYTDSQRDYERRIKMSDSKALQDPKIREKYERIKTLETWYRDYQSDFSEQKKTIELLKSHGIGLNIDNVKYQTIKDQYLRFNKYHRHTYQNMVIIFLAIVSLALSSSFFVSSPNWCNELGFPNFFVSIVCMALATSFATCVVAPLSRYTFILGRPRMV